LIYDGLIRERGSPRELRAGLGLDRLEVRATDLARAAAALEQAGDFAGDVQRFGDRLDVLVPDAANGEREVRRILAAAGVSGEVRASLPTLENVFVMALRAFGTDVRAPAFPYAREARRVAGSAAPAHRDVAIGAQGLRKSFGSFVAVRGLDLDVRYGEIYGLLGANGAGKTTAIKMLCGLLDPTGGEVELVGANQNIRSPAVRARIGYMSQKFSLYDDLTVEENLDFFAGVYRVPRDERAAKKRWVLEFSGLEREAQRLTGTLPGGWKQRVAFGAAVMHEPSVLFLDEPTSGVDPLARRAFWKMIDAFADRGVAVLVTTHYLEEAEQCNRLGLMVAGEVVSQGTPSAIKAQQPGHLLEIVTDHPQDAADLLRASGTEPWRVALFGDRLHLVVDADAAAAIARTSERLRAGGVRVAAAYEQPYSLEDAFIALVRHEQRAQDGLAG
jgi:ABC-2 type transport system ATP-binding protein